MKVSLVKQLYFEAAHRNRKAGGPQARVHGHSYRVEVLAEGAPDDTIGWVVDFAELKRLAAGVCEELDHTFLNDHAGLEENSTLPALERWIVERIAVKPSWFAGIRVSIVGDLAFRPRRLAADEAARLPERIGFTFEAAQSLPQLPEGHPCRQIHGHSYRLEVGATDAEGLERQLAALYRELDHRYLNDLPGLASATVERICRWIWNWLTTKGLALTVVVVQETNTSRCVYYGE